jgi:hypothetical protein
MARVAAANREVLSSRSWSAARTATARRSKKHPVTAESSRRRRLLVSEGTRRYASPAKRSAFGGELQPELGRVVDAISDVRRVIEEDRIGIDAELSTDAADADVVSELVVDESGAEIERAAVVEELEERLVDSPVVEIEARVEEKARLEEERAEEKSTEGGSFRGAPRNSDEAETERGGPGKAAHEVDRGESVDSREDREGGEEKSHAGETCALA